MTPLQITWYLLVGLLLTIFAILDGFDLGVGFWFLGTRREEHRRALLRSIGPFWDGNEVWLLTGGGALFAAFPPVYATVFSGFYLAMMLVLLALIMRAVSPEFRSQHESPRWRSTWDVTFAAGSVVAGLLFGVALGNIMRGIPLDAAGNYTGTFWTLLNPYALLIGILGLAMLAFHGAIYIILKTTGDLALQAGKWARQMGYAYLGLYLVASATTLITQQHLVTGYRQHLLLWLFPVLALLLILAAQLYLRLGRPGRAFACSSLSIAGLMGTVAAGLFPRLVPALGQPELSLTAANASSSHLTLQTMLILALVGMPFVIGYTLWVYRAFGGKVDPTEEGGHY
jgi:cytochrome d ubiquinol oxidase subunit II